MDALLLLIPVAIALGLVAGVNRLDRKPSVRRAPGRSRWERAELRKTGIRLGENLVIGVPTFVFILWLIGKA